MENNEKKENPVFKVSPGLNQSVELKIVRNKEMSTGNNQYGDWFMWLVEVKDANVIFGKGSDKTQQSNYTGEAITFLKESLHKKIQTIINGEEGVVINVKKEAKEGHNGTIYGEFVVTKVSSGVVPTNSSSTLTPTEVDLIKDMQSFLNLGYSLDENVLIGMAGEEKYKAKGITLEKIKILAEQAINLYNNKVKQ